MASEIEQSRLIGLIEEARGFNFEPYTSADDITSNFKVNLAEVVSDKPCVRGAFVREMTKEIFSQTTDMSAVVATGGAVGLASEVADQIGCKVVEIGADRADDEQQKVFSIDEDDLNLIINGYLKSKNAIFIEDVSSTFNTVSKAAEQTRILGMIGLCVVGWRRGRPAPEGMGNDDWALDYNRRNSHDVPYEVELPFPVRSVIRREVPLWLPGNEKLPKWIQELVTKETEQPTETDRPFAQSPATVSS